MDNIMKLDQFEVENIVLLLFGVIITYIGFISYGIIPTIIGFVISAISIGRLSYYIMKHGKHK